jgi:hypothetical protein
VSQAQVPFKANHAVPGPPQPGGGRFFGRWAPLVGTVGAAVWVTALSFGRASHERAGEYAALSTASHSISENRDGPMPGFTGGFGEKTCRECHFQDSLNAAPGTVTISGAPESWVPGATYPVTVTLTRPRMDLGGFQLTARFEDDGAQAGTLSVEPKDSTRMKVTADQGVQYAHHVRPGAVLAVRDTARWTVLWTAPPAGGPVRFHTAANAASDDDSPLGDYIYATSVRSSAPQR